MGRAKPVPVHLVDNAARFEQVIARWDGSAFWFQEVDRREDPEIAETLSAAFSAETAVNSLGFLRMTREMRSAYSLVWFRKVQDDEDEELARLLEIEHEQQEIQRRQVREARHFIAQQKRYAEKGEKRLRNALETAGGKLKSARESGDNWLVNWTTSDGEVHSSVISRHNLTVVSAGICLDGYDNWFDLESLVAVVEQRPGWS
jgi:hypothetical protein